MICIDKWRLFFEYFFWPYIASMITTVSKYRFYVMFFLQMRLKNITEYSNTQLSMATVKQCFCMDRMLSLRSKSLNISISNEYLTWNRMKFISIEMECHFSSTDPCQIVDLHVLYSMVGFCSLNLDICWNC